MCGYVVLCMCVRVVCLPASEDRRHSNKSQIGTVMIAYRLIIKMQINKTLGALQLGAVVCAAVAE